MGTSAEEDNYNADVDGEGNQIQFSESSYAVKLSAIPVISIGNHMGPSKIKD